MNGIILVVGLGEVGMPLFEIISSRYDAVGIDIEPVEIDGSCEVMHICIPFEIDDFISQTVGYFNTYKPRLTIINSTIAPGTTRAIHLETHASIVHSPVRGKHIKMKQELLHYVKFVGGIDEKSSREAAKHFQSIGMKTKIFSSPEATELAKLTATTYYALQIAWAQEVERYCDKLSLDYDEVVSIFEEIDYLPPVKYFPGVIGGHCLMPNITILKTVENSRILDVIEDSNQRKIASIGNQNS